MAFGDLYSAGTVSVTSGNTAVTGVGTLWSLALVAGDSFESGGIRVTIKTVTDDTHLVLAYGWPGSNLSGASYVVREDSGLRHDPTEMTGRVRDLLQTLQVFDTALPIIGVNSAVTAPTGSEATGTKYRVLPGATGAFAGHDNQIAEKQDTGWFFTVPEGGWQVFDDSTFYPLAYDGAGNWNRLSGPYDVPVWIAGRPIESEIIFKMKFVTQVKFATAIAGSLGVADVAATADSIFSVQKNGSEVGQVKFAASSSTAVFIAASPFTFNPGDVLSIVAPAVRDATLSNIAFTLTGTR
ncbi:MAG TPA: DUF2793 domain-containing protein [Xanthobacteraceae bacterium]|nr:DUF2793 domain-containing protein [Xanthobacteraceae bacterium]